ncbi:MAG: UDP-N-acetylmuramyl peptide synthase, partial [Solobacterium sp.]|nr:UDP-N-acetylmuramyl peptide synthase [Solobacterium sp.]
CTYGLVNLDSDHRDEILEAAKAAKKVITFSETNVNADFYGYDVHKVENDIVFKVRGSDFDEEFKLSMPGLFNVSNALCAIAIARLYDIPISDIQEGLYHAKVPGRMEIYTSNDKKITAIVDYAHNQLSFQKLFESVRNEYPGYRATIIFGCPGKKAQDRRHDLGEIAGKNADYIYLTEEDAGEEDPLAIAQEIARAVEKEKAPYEIIIDREQAIARAVEDAANAKGNTVILITGKGAETRQKRGIEYIPVMSDVECVNLELKKYNEK